MLTSTPSLEEYTETYDHDGDGDGSGDPSSYSSRSTWMVGWRAHRWLGREVADYWLGGGGADRAITRVLDVLSVK